MSESLAMPRIDVVEFHVEHPTAGSNAREQHFARARRVRGEREAMRKAWLANIPREGLVGLLVPTRVFRMPYGVDPKLKRKAKQAGIDLRKHEGVLKPVYPLLVTLTRIAWGRGLDPFENLPVALKGMADELAWQLGVDDKCPLVQYRARQEGGPRPKYQAVHVRIERRPASPHAPEKDGAG
jgi:hypothetical protein